MRGVTGHDVADPPDASVQHYELFFFYFSFFSLHLGLLMAMKSLSLLDQFITSAFPAWLAIHVYFTGIESYSSA